MSVSMPRLAMACRVRRTRSAYSSRLKFNGTSGMGRASLALGLVIGQFAESTRVTHLRKRILAMEDGAGPGGLGAGDGERGDGGILGAGTGEVAERDLVARTPARSGAGDDLAELGKRGVA